MVPARTSFVNRLNEVLSNGRTGPSVHPLPPRPPPPPVPRRRLPYHPCPCTLPSQSTDTIPRGFLVAPSLKGKHNWLNRHSIRLLTCCQGPSVKGKKDAFHMTQHGGYTVELPRDYEYNHKKTIKRVENTAKEVAQVVKVAGGIAGHDVSSPVELATSALMSVQQTVDNKTRLGRAGIDPDNMFSMQFVEDYHQRKGMEELLRSIAERKRLHNITEDLKGIVLKDGRTVWVCDQCHDCLQRNVPIKETDNLTLHQYMLLVRRERRVEVTLHNPASVIVFTDAFTRLSSTEEMIIHIDRTYFEASMRSEGAPLNSIVHLFNELGQALQGQKALKRLEIHCNSTTDGKVYAGLQAVLQCPLLEALHVSRIACFLDGRDIPIKSRNVKELRLQDVLVDTDQAMRNLERLIQAWRG